MKKEKEGGREGIIRRNMEDDYGVRAKQWQHYTSRQGSALWRKDEGRGKKRWTD